MRSSNWRARSSAAECEGAQPFMSSNRPPKSPSPEIRERMRNTRRRDTKPELELRSLLHRSGLRFFVDRPVLPDDRRRRADIVFPRAKVAVFVNGCFWHGCPEHASWPKNNAAWWRAKIEKNRDRDADTDRRLRSAGWVPVRIWEHDAPEIALLEVRKVVNERRRQLAEKPDRRPGAS